MFALNFCQCIAKSIQKIVISRDDGSIQVEFDGGRSRPDMVIELSGGAMLGIENKLWADEGDGQLGKYLRLGWNYNRLGSRLNLVKFFPTADNQNK